MEKDKDEMCIISVMFPATDDNFAISVKAKIQEMLSSIPDAKIDFRLGNIGRSRGPLPPQ